MKLITASQMHVSKFTVFFPSFIFQISFICISSFSLEIKIYCLVDPHQNNFHSVITKILIYLVNIFKYFIIMID